MTARPGSSRRPLALPLQEDVVCLMCTSSGDAMTRGYLAAEGFGSQVCHLQLDPRSKVLQLVRPGYWRCCLPWCKAVTDLCP